MSSRRSKLATIHIGKKQLGMTDDEYRLMLASVAGVDSAKDCDDEALNRVIDRMRELGFRPQRKRRARPAPEREALVRKVRALLANYRRPDGYADSMAKHMFGVDRFEWLEADQLRRLVAALEIDRRRRQARSEG